MLELSRLIIQKVCSYNSVSNGEKDTKLMQFDMMSTKPGVRNYVVSIRENRYHYHLVQGKFE